MRTRASSRPVVGFTLIEIVISTAVMSLILVSAYLCLNSGVLSQRLVEGRTEAVQSARVALALISADLRAACPLTPEIQFLGMRRLVEDVEADNLDFATHNYSSRRAHETDFCEVSYFLAREPESGKLSLWRRRDATIDDEPLEGGSREEIVRGVRGIRFEYYDGYDWYTEWGDSERRGKREASELDPPNLSGMPEAVRVTLWIDSDSRRAAATTQNQEAQDEPPIVMQTVARLNLAVLAQRSGSTRAARTAGGQSGPATTPGGQP